VSALQSSEEEGWARICSMTPEQARPGMRVRVMEHHRVEERRGLIGTVVARYGVGEYVAMDVRLAEGRLRMFWPMDLEEIPYPHRHGGACCSVGRLQVNSDSYSPECVEGAFSEVRLQHYAWPRSYAENVLMYKTGR
jgi:hypothetical protein